MRWRRRIGSDWIGSATVSAWSENREAGTRDERERERETERSSKRESGRELADKNSGRVRAARAAIRRGAARRSRLRVIKRNDKGQRWAKTKQ